jgi:hypothetical protein
MFYLGIRKWPIFEYLSQTSVVGYPRHVPIEKVRENQEYQKSFIMKYDAPRTIFRIAKRSFETSLAALFVAAFVALLDTVS